MLRRLWYHINFPVYIQRNSSDCGIQCLRMVLAYYKLPHAYALVSKYLSFDSFGTNFKSIKLAAEHLGLEVLPVKVTYSELIKLSPLPAILHWNQDHFVILYKISADFAWIVDPANGIKKLPIKEFISNCLIEEKMQVPKGTVLLFQKNNEFVPESKISFFSNIANQIQGSYLYILISILSGICIAFLFMQVQIVIPLKGILSQKPDSNYILLSTIGILCTILGLLALSLIDDKKNLSLDINSCFSNLGDEIKPEKESVYNSLICFYKLNYHKKYKTRFWISITLILGVLIYIFYLPFFLFLISIFISLLYFLIKLALLNQHERETAKYVNEATSLQSEIYKFYEKTKTLVQSGKDPGNQNELYSILKDRNTEIHLRTNSRLINILYLVYVLLIILFIGDNLLSTAQGIISCISLFICLLSIESIAKYLWNSRNLGLYLQPGKSDSKTNQEVEEITFNNYDIHLQNLGYTYPSLNWSASVRNLDSEIPFGTKLAIIGSPGSGKSTLLKLITGILTATEGKIMIDDIDTTQFSNATLSKYIGSLNEETKIVDGTIAWNIALEEEYDINRINKIVKELYLDYIIAGLPQGLETNIEDEEVYLSPNINLKILLARLLYLNKPINIIDLPDLDINDMHHLILYESLFTACRDKTIIFVTTNIELAQSVDKIIFMEDGEIVDQGSYKELIANKDMFFNYVNQQKMMRT